VAIKSTINFDSLFEPDLNKTTPVEEPEEGEELETKQEEEDADENPPSPRINN
jgi:hypothetical protein